MWYLIVFYTALSLGGGPSSSVSAMETVVGPFTMEQQCILGMGATYTVELKALRVVEWVCQYHQAPPWRLQRKAF